jgi:hypothetical protein
VTALDKPLSSRVTLRDERTVVSWRSMFTVVFALGLVGACGWILFGAITQLVAGTAIYIVDVFAVLAIALGYAGVGMLVNRTELYERQGALHVWRGPLPWSGQAIAFDDIERLAVGQARRAAKEEGIQLDQALGTNFNVDVIT